MNPLRFPFLLLTTLCTGAATAQDWYPELQTSAPAARRFHSLHHVAGAQYLFGGVDERTNTVFGDMWRYDGIAWTPVVTPGPSARQRFASCVDTVHDVLLVFGGIGANGQVLGDTWKFDGSTWSVVTAHTPPAARMGAAMAFDAVRGRVVMFGGGPTASAPTGETWEFDGATWTQLAPANAPSARQGHAMTFDPARGTTLLFGGMSAGTTSFGNDTWAWNGAAWRQLATATSPSASPFPAMTFFAAHGVAVLTGSTGGGATQALATWVFDGTDWSAGPTAPGALIGRQGHAIAYDRVREMVALFGGARIALGGAVPFADTWELAVRATAIAYGSGCALPVGGTPLLEGRSLPQLGGSLDVAVSPAGTLALFVAGLDDTTFLGAPLPADLAPLGLPGCRLLTSVDVATFALPDGGGATASLDVPLWRALIGQSFFVQALVADGAHAATSNALRATVGN
jgi:hypothetical protein